MWPHIHSHKRPKKLISFCHINFVKFMLLNEVNYIILGNFPKDAKERIKFAHPFSDA